MAELTKQQLRQLEQQMRERQRVLVAEVRDERTRTATGADDEPTGVVGDAGDESVARMMTDLGIQETERDIEELSAIDGALKRIGDGSYGYCDNCGGEIEFRRLEVQPTAIRCVPCQSQFEKTHAHKSTPTL